MQRHRPLRALCCLGPRGSTSWGAAGRALMGRPEAAGLRAPRHGGPDVHCPVLTVPTCVPWPSASLGQQRGSSVLCSFRRREGARPGMGERDGQVSAAGDSAHREGGHTSGLNPWLRRAGWASARCFSQGVGCPHVCSVRLGTLPGPSVPLSLHSVALHGRAPRPRSTP